MCSKFIREIIFFLIKTYFWSVCYLYYFVKQFEKPGRRDDFDYPQMVKESVSKALTDANIKYTDLKQAVVGYVYGS